ncbi:Uncharacterised protein [uncultured archaeon]|nr:Uncharacterised protein [uncultured archaeon]
MNLIKKLTETDFIKTGAAIILAGILSFGIGTCINEAYNLEKQAENYLENLYLNSPPDF